MRFRGQAGGQPVPLKAAMNAATRQFGVDAAPHGFDEIVERQSEAAAKSTHVLVGPYCTYLLGLLGAEVIKIEPPSGEWGRDAGPAESSPGAGLDAGFAAQAAGKRMLAIDIRTPDGHTHRRQDLFPLGSSPAGERGRQFGAERLCVPRAVCARFPSR